MASWKGMEEIFTLQLCMWKIVFFSSIVYRRREPVQTLSAIATYVCKSHNAVALKGAIHLLSVVIHYANACATTRGAVKQLGTITSLTCMIVMVWLASKYDYLG